MESELHIFSFSGFSQGDPLSSYLFIICADGLSHLLWEAEGNKTVFEFWVIRQAPSITYLFFADDNITFFKAHPQKCLAIMDILKIYENEYDQKINFKKSSMMFSKNVDKGDVLMFINFERFLGL